MLHKKHFSLPEAQALLNEAKITLAKITGLKKDLEESGFNIYSHQYFGGIGPNGTGKFPEDLELLIKLLHNLSEKGIIVKNIEEGLIDFPHIRENGEEVYLCYLHGEEDIEYWHSINGGFAGRRSIEDL